MNASNGDNFIFAIGGYSDGNLYAECLESVEYFNTVKFWWADAPKLNTARANASSCLIGHTIYTFCGYNYVNSSLNSIEKLTQIDVVVAGNISRVEWELISPEDKNKFKPRYNAMVA